MIEYRGWTTMSCKEKYPVKRAYAVGKLYKFLKQKGIYKEFIKECKRQNEIKGQTEITEAFVWYRSELGVDYWLNVDREFTYYLQGVDVDKT